MYCSNCGTPRTQGLSYCNRCGADLRERREAASTGAISAMLTAITLIGIAGLGIMLGGAMVLRKGAGLPPDLIGVFMLFTFLITVVTEILLVRNLSKLTSANQTRHYLPPAPPLNHDTRLPPASTVGEPVPSVTENTTRTLDYIRRQQ
ncbi:MAG TPA: zinc ribbon domain-containing protein [Pyrinomonadaceae bacterium]|nr:zinc ribbon domain-containing protein [Pyrinomonadaceae bacterium]